jgi:hypothetical protein
MWTSWKATPPRPEKPGEMAPVRLDDFVFGLLAVAGATASTLGRVLGPTPGVTQAAALRAELPSRLSELASAIGRTRARDFALRAPASWPTRTLRRTHGRSSRRARIGSCTEYRDAY